MAQLSLTQISNGDSLDASVVDSNFDAIANLLNGNLEADNVLANSQTATRTKAEALTAWSPTYSASGSLTYTTVTTTIARYIQVGKYVFFRIEASGTTGGTTSTVIYATLPVTAKDTSHYWGSFVSDGGSIAGFTFLNSTTQLGFQRYDAGNWSLGAARRIGLTGWYEAA